MDLALMYQLQTLHINKQMLKIEHKLLRIPRLHSWLCNRCDRNRDRMEDLNQGPPGFKSSTLNHIAMLHPLTGAKSDK